jgi:hypothetical protein
MMRASQLSDEELLNRMLDEELTEVEVLDLRERSTSDDFRSKMNAFIVAEAAITATQDQRREPSRMKADIDMVTPDRSREKHWLATHGLPIASAALIIMLVFVLISREPGNVRSGVASAGQHVTSLNRGDPLAQAYASGNYELIAHEASARLRSNAADSVALFYRGLARMQFAEFRSAANDLEGLVAQRGRLHDEARWYRALAYLGARKYRECADLLRAIESGRGRYALSSRILADYLGECH